MLHEKVFDIWLNELFQKHKLNSEKKKEFKFLTFNNYPFNIEQKEFVIYEDWWIKNPEIVKSKIKSILGLSNRIFGRECIVKKIDKLEADSFLKENHLYGSVKSKTKYGLFFENELYAVVTFAGQRQFHDGSRSVELIRYCSKNNYTVVGGLDKLLQTYIKANKPDSMMTYVDLDWGRGLAFDKLGFQVKTIKESINFYANKLTGERTPEKYFEDFDNIEKYVKVLNKGSIKMIKNVQNNI